ncbi:MAG TPA: DUF4276 family protein, partial [Bacteroidetes bacterium]|nr:DUF4276 family protein [Bacteroidota bacterium]
SDRSNGTLSQGFHKLIKQLLEGNMPRIIMGNGKSQAINKFKKNKLSDLSYLLIDLDDEEKQKETQLTELDLKDQEDIVFFMIQEMEAWFISQPKILDQYYKEKISTKLPKTNPKKIKDPVAILENLTRKTKKGKYHKVRHGTSLLELLNAGDLKSSFEEFNRMVSEISKG